MNQKVPDKKGGGLDYAEVDTSKNVEINGKLVARRKLEELTNELGVNYEVLDDGVKLTSKTYIGKIGWMDIKQLHDYLVKREINGRQLTEEDANGRARAVLRKSAWFWVG